MAFDIIADRRALHDASRSFVFSLRTAESLNSPYRNTWRDHANNIPSEAIFKPLYPQIVDGSATRPALPTAAECAVHLEFLQTLYVLRQRILKSVEMDGVFNIQPDHKVVRRKGEDVKLKDNTLWPRRQDKWEKWVRLAAIRFLVWWESLHAIFDISEGEVRDVRITDDTLPPLGKSRRVLP